MGRATMISLGAVAMFVSMVLRKKQFPQVALWKMIVLTVWLTITGVLGTMILAYIESGKFGGTSFYGAVLMVPVLIMPAMLMKTCQKSNTLFSLKVCMAIARCFSLGIV